MAEGGQERVHPSARQYYGEVGRETWCGARDSASRQGLIAAFFAGFLGFLIFWGQKGGSQAVKHIGHWVLYTLAPIGLLFLALIGWNLVLAPLVLARKRSSDLSEAVNTREEALAERDEARREADQTPPAPVIDVSGLEEGDRLVWSVEKRQEGEAG